TPARSASDGPIRRLRSGLVRIEMIHAHIQVSAQPVQGADVQFGYLRDGEEVYHVLLFRSSSAGAFHHFHGILGPGLENGAGGLFEQGTLAVRQAGDALEYRPLSLFLADHGASVRITQLSSQPALDQGILAMVFVVADEARQPVGEVPGAAPGGAGAPA